MKREYLTERSFALSGAGLVLLLLGTLTQASEDDPAQINRDRLVVETVGRLENFDVEGNPKIKEAILRHVRRQGGTIQFVQLSKRFQLKEMLPELVDLAIKNAGNTVGVQAAEVVVELGGIRLLTKIVNGKSSQRAAQAISVLGHVDNQQIRTYLVPLATDATTSRVVRNAAVRALGRSRLGEKELLALAAAKKTREDTRFAVGNILLSSSDPAIREEASRYFKLPAGANATSFPPISEMLKRKGNVAKGGKLFATTASCSKCHKVRGQGKEVGPDLSEIGSKLTREALYVSILDPSAGISHNYEMYLIELASGNIVSGVIISRTDEALVLKDKEAIEKVIKTSDIDLIKKSEVSLMPADLVKTLTEEKLADIVEFLSSLKKTK